MALPCVPRRLRAEAGPDAALVEHSRRNISGRIGSNGGMRA